ncbi:heterokaryon incompatibility protein [Colletotrichum truncatum]|uniref:Heterokaryon incompatibility protein n=1 Tax=Colletotrichum truncatum TaxID=5467 RepID=A0ACC3Z6K8_COLTU
MSTFKYRDILQDDEIRLLRLLPGDWLDDLEAQLHLADQTWRYIALSYAWGSTKRSNQIIVNGEVKHITFNLDRALRAIRQKTKPVVIWIDSICINQNDAVEKGHQVGLMHDIFSSAIEVVACVGDGLDRSLKDYTRRFEKLGKLSPITFAGDQSDIPLIERSIDLWKRSPPGSLSEQDEIICLYSLISAALHESFFNTKKPQQEGEETYSANQWFPKRESPADEHRLQQISERMRVFAVSDWWNRMWVVQEACVAKKLTILYGRASIPFRVIVQGAREFLDSSSPKPFEFMKVVSYMAEKADAIDFFRFRGSFRTSSVATNSSLLWLLRNFRDRRSSEPRDKIYALLRLAKDLKRETLFSHVDLNIDTDYEISVSNLFSQVAYEIFKQTGLMWVTTSDLLAKSRKDIPSWVPDWSSDNPIPGFSQQRVRFHGELFQVFNTSGAMFRHFHAVDGVIKEDVVSPQQHYERLANGEVDVDLRWETTHRLPVLSIYATSTGTSVMEVDIEEQLRLALNLNGISCGLIEDISDPIMSDLSNLPEVILQTISKCWQLVQGGELLHRKPLMEILACALCSSIRTESGPDGYKAPSILSTDQMRQASYWALRHAMEHLPNTRYYDPRLINLFEADFEDNLISWIAALKEDTELSIYIKIIRDHTFWDLRSKEKLAMWCCSHPAADDSTYSAQGGVRLFTFTRDFSPRGEFDSDHSVRLWSEDKRWIEDTIRAVAGGCRLFVTSRGLVGLGPEAMRAGDEVCILEGGLMPYILRKRLKKRIMAMVGTCYVEGIMHRGQGDSVRGSNSEYIGSRDMLQQQLRQAWSSHREEFILY